MVIGAYGPRRETNGRYSSFLPRRFFFGSHFDTEKLRSSSSASLSIQGEPEFKWKVKRERPKRIETTTELCLEPNDLL